MPLHIAVEQDHPVVLKMLLDAKANTLLCNAAKKTPLHASGKVISPSRHQIGPNSRIGQIARVPFLGVLVIVP